MRVGDRMPRSGVWARACYVLVTAALGLVVFGLLAYVAWNGAKLWRMVQP